MRTVIAGIVLCLGAGSRVSAQDPIPEAQAAARERALHERVVALKKSLQESMAALRAYEWIETTITSLKGEEKARKQNRCYHGADGKLQKVPVGEVPDADKGRGLRGKIKAKKKEELADYMEKASELVHQYVPPNPARIQQAKDAGKASIHILEPEQRIRVEFRDYLLPGDSLSIEVDVKANRILGVTVASYLDSPEDKVGLDIRFALLADGSASYPSQTTLDAAAKKVRVTVENSGYRKLPG